MRIGGEEVELVTSFGSLRAGMIVWRTPCSFCDGKHRGILGALTSGLTKNAFESFEEGVHFALYPATGHSLTGSAVSKHSVDAGTIFRVVDPLLAQTTTRAREAVRT